MGEDDGQGKEMHDARREVRDATNKDIDPLRKMAQDVIRLGVWLLNSKVGPGRAAPGKRQEHRCIPSLYREPLHNTEAPPPGGMSIIENGVEQVSQLAQER